MPCDYRDYPADFKAVALAVKAAAGWTCEACGRPCRKPGEDLPAFQCRMDDLLESQGRRPSDYTDMYREIEEHPQRWTLTVHHPDHDTANPNARLQVLCAPCHLRFDHAHHVAKARETRQQRRRERGQLGLEVAG